MHFIFIFFVLGYACGRQILQNNEDVDWTNKNKNNQISNQPIVANANYKYEDFENLDNIKRSRSDDDYAKYKCMQAFDLQEQSNDLNYAKNLREEVSKLQDLVQVLRDQQYILRILNEVDRNTPHDFVPHSLMNHLKKIQDEKEDIDIRQTFEALDSHQDVNNLRKEIEALKASISKPKEYKKLDEQMRLQRDEIVLLRNMMDKVLNKNTDVDNYGQGKSNVTKMLYELSKIENKLGQIASKNYTEDILGAPPPKFTGYQQNLTSIHNFSRAANEDDIESILSLLGGKAKSSAENDNIADLLKTLSKQSKANSLELDEEDLQDQLKDLQKKLKKKKKKSSIEDQLKKLEKQIKLQSKTEDDDDEEDEDDSKAQLKKLQLTIKKLNKKGKVQTKTDDDDEDVESQLKHLAKAIKGLQSKDDEEGNEEADFSVNLNKLVSKNRKPKLSQSQIRALRKKLMAMKQGNHKTGYNQDVDAEDDKPIFSYEEIDSEEEYTKPLITPNHYQYGYNKKNQFNGYGFHQYFPNYNPNMNYNQYNPSPNYNNARPNHYQKQYTPNNNQYNSNYNTDYNNNYEATANYKPAYTANSKSYTNQNPQYVQESKVPAHVAVQPTQYTLHQPKAEAVNTKSTSHYLPAEQSSPQFFPASQQPKLSAPAYNPNPPQNPQEPYQNPLPNQSPEQKVSDLKNQIYELQGVIDTFNKPEYLQQPEDKQAVYNLDRQIKDLKVVINNITQDYPTYQTIGNVNQQQPISTTTSRFARLVEDPVFRNAGVRKHSKGLDIAKREIVGDSAPKIENCDENNGYRRNPKKSNKKIRNKRNDESSDEADSALNTLSSLFGQAFLGADEEDDNVQARSKTVHPKLFGDVEKRIEEVKKQLGSINQRSNYYQPILNYDSETDEDEEEEKQSKNLFKIKKKSKKLDIFEKIFDKILNKVIDKAQIALPKILETLVGKFDLNSYYNDGQYGDGYEMDKNYKSNFGLFGFLPIIAIKVISNISYFVSYLHKYRFLRVFLVPALTLLLVAGAIIFLVWWLQPSEDYQQVSYSGDSNYVDSNNYDNNKYYESAYSKTYKNKYNKQNYNNYGK